MGHTDTVPHIILQRLEHTPATAQWRTRETQGRQPVQPFSPATRASETPSSQPSSVSTSHDSNSQTLMGSGQVCCAVGSWDRWSEVVKGFDIHVCMWVGGGGGGGGVSPRNSPLQSLSGYDPSPSCTQAVPVDAKILSPPPYSPFLSAALPRS